MKAKPTPPPATEAPTTPRALMTYSPRELAAELKIPNRIVFQAMRSGKLKAMRFTSATMRIDGASVDAWLETLTK
jgi:excisionase family DNA binding protein